MMMLCTRAILDADLTNWSVYCCLSVNPPLQILLLLLLLLAERTPSSTAGVEISGNG